jgi:dihydrofolate synthase/folylpolyglutamate synthase
LATNLMGRHQAGNACLALGALEVLAQAGIPVGPGQLHQGLKQVNWPGRMEQFHAGGQGPTVWLDGAHNLPAARNMVENLDLVRQGRSPLVMVLGVMADKDLSAMLELFVPAADYVVFSRPAYERAAAPEVLAQAAPADSAPWELEPDLGRALMRAGQLAGPQGVVLVTGSLFTVGEARAILGGETRTDLP